VEVNYSTISSLSNQITEKDEQVQVLSDNLLKTSTTLEEYKNDLSESRLEIIKRDNFLVANKVALGARRSNS